MKSLPESCHIVAFHYSEERDERLPQEYKTCLPETDSITLITPAGKKDFFEIFTERDDVLNRALSTSSVLYLDLSQLSPDALHHFLSSNLQSEQVSFQVQNSSTATPGTLLPLPYLLTRPLFPCCIYLPQGCLNGITGAAELLTFHLWDILISLSQNLPISMSEYPHADTHQKNLVDFYKQWIEKHDSNNSQNIPTSFSEWLQLRKTLHAAVLERHQELFKEHISTALSATEHDRYLIDEQYKQHLSDYSLVLKLTWHIKKLLGIKTENR